MRASAPTEPLDTVDLTSVWRVVVRIHGEERAREFYPVASRAFIQTGRYLDWVAVKHPRFDQLLGYRRVNPKDWFLLRGESQVIEGPFASKKLILSYLRAKSAAKIRAGVYEVKEDLLFTRDCAEHVAVKPEELPL